MRIEDILKIDDFNQVVKLLCVDTINTETSYISGGISERAPKDYIAEYNGDRGRRSTGVDKRENKTVPIYSETETDEKGNPKKIDSKTVLVARVKTTKPKKIVQIAKAFLFGGDMRVTFSEQNEGAQYFKSVWVDELKMKSVLSDLAEICKIETKSAVIFYPSPGTDDAGKSVLKIRCMVLSNKNNEFYPHFDDYGDMDAFTRKYKAYHVDGKIHEFIWIQTAEKEILKVNNAGNWEDIKNGVNPAKKITVVYIEQNAPEWEEVATMIDYYENRISRLVDTNDYFADPILKTYGNTLLPTKESVGKTLEFDYYIDDEGKEHHGDAEYLESQNSPESVKLELTTLKNEIDSGSCTPDTTLENLKSLGNVSTATAKMLFLDAFIKAKESRLAIYDKAVQRCVSIVKTLISEVTQVKYKNDLLQNRIAIEFGSILPEDLKELFEILSTANGNKPVNSQETITSISPFTQDVTQEMERLTAEADAESQRQNLVGISIPPDGL